jgi:hypothetical protein
LSQPDEEVPGQLRRAILNRTRTRERATSGFATLEEAVAARCKVADIPRVRHALSASDSWRRGQGAGIGAVIPVCDLSPLRMSEGRPRP